MGRRRRWFLWGLGLAGAAAGAALLLVAIRYYPAYRSAMAAKDDLQQAQALLEERRLDATDADIARIDALLENAERSSREADAVLSDPLVSAGHHIPFAGDSVRAMSELSAIGVDGTRLGRDALAVVRTYRDLRDRTDGDLAAHADAIFADLDPPMAAVAWRVAALEERRARLDGALLPPAVAGAIDELDRGLADMEELVATYRDLSSFVPRFLGFEGERTYLVLAQNNAELLPTGGLISVYGVIVLRDGRIVEKQFADAVRLSADWLSSGVYVEPPGPLDRYLLKGTSWDLTVSNWSPDFPTAAQEAERFFHLATGRDVDGVIAINVHTIEELLGVTGPVPVPDYGVTVTAENALDVIEAHTRDGEGDRKAFTGALAEELLSRLTDLDTDQWTPLLEALQRLRDERQIMLFADDPALQTLSEHLALDGGLAQPDGDYLMVVDASVNSTKLNVALRQQIEVEVRVNVDGSAYHRTTLRYKNDLPAWSRGRDPALVSRLMLGGLYGGYVRLLAPAGSVLDGVTLDGRDVGPEEIAVEDGKASFGRFFPLPSGQRTELTFRHTAPGVVRAADGCREYRLFIQKQSGTDRIPLSIILRLPQGADLDWATLDGAPVEKPAWIQTDLAQDRELAVCYEVD